MKKIFISILLLLGIILPLGAQSALIDELMKEKEARDAAAAASPPPEETATATTEGELTRKYLDPEGYRSYTFGMKIDNVKALLLEDPYFNYRGDPDVSFLPKTEEPLIACEGNGFIKEAYFQFHEKKLYIITLVLNPLKIDYYTVFTGLQKIYGAFTSLSPKEVIWDFGEVLLSIEKPLTVKYIDKEVFDAINAAGEAEEDMENLSRQEFLKEF